MAISIRSVSRRHSAHSAVRALLVHCYARCLVEDQTMAETDPFDNVLFFLSHNLDEEDRQELIPAIRVRFEEWWSSFDIDRKTVEQFAVKMV